jgi:hypothetical protein
VESATGTGWRAAGHVAGAGAVGATTAACGGELAHALAAAGNPTGFVAAVVAAVALAATATALLAGWFGPAERGPRDVRRPGVAIGLAGGTATAAMIFATGPRLALPDYDATRWGLIGAVTFAVLVGLQWLGASGPPLPDRSSEPAR